jgi:predicted RNase H-like HicB family nuclease
MGIVDFVNDSNKVTGSVEDWGPQKVYRCHVCLIPEDDGTFSAIVLNLPGTGSCGRTREEAIENVREAILGVIESHTAHGESIPWKDPDPAEIPSSGEPKWILVNA